MNKTNSIKHALIEWAQEGCTSDEEYCIDPDLWSVQSCEEFGIENLCPQCRAAYLIDKYCD